MNELVSIIIPAYNSEKYIRKTINSITSQTYRNIEIIICDDGSTDTSKNIYEELCNNDSRIKIIYGKHGGVSNNRNKGIEEASGKYIMFVDSDDWLEKNTVEKLINVSKEDTEVVIFKFKNYLKNKKKEVKNKEILFEDGIYKMQELLPKLIISEIFNACWNKFYKAEIIKDNNIRFDKKIEIGEDFLFNVDYFNNINNIYFLNDKLYNYRIGNQNSLTKKYKENKYEQLMKVNDRVLEWVKKFNNEEINNACKYIRFKNIISCIRDLHNKKCQYTKLEKIEYIKSIKKNNNKIILKNVNFLIFILSCIYSFLPTKLIFWTCKYI